MLLIYVENGTSNANATPLQIERFAGTKSFCHEIMTLHAMARTHTHTQIQTLSTSEAIKDVCGMWQAACSATWDRDGNRDVVDLAGAGTNHADWLRMTAK